jgi:hypothetical protein
VSESEHLPESSEEELAIETFVDRMKEIHPNLDREELREEISKYVRDAMEDANGEEETEEDE